MCVEFRGIVGIRWVYFLLKVCICRSQIVVKIWVDTIVFLE